MERKALRNPSNLNFDKSEVSVIRIKARTIGAQNVRVVLKKKGAQRSVKGAPLTHRARDFASMKKYKNQFSLERSSEQNNRQFDD